MNQLADENSLVSLDVKNSLDIHGKAFWLAVLWLAFQIGLCRNQLRESRDRILLVMAAIVVLMVSMSYRFN